MFPPVYNTSGVVGCLNSEPGEVGGLIVTASGRTILKLRNLMANPPMKSMSILAAFIGQGGYKGRSGPGHRK